MKYKPLKIKNLEGDSVGFIQILEELVNRLIIRDDIAEIKLIKIKNWFDHKWLKYSGKGIIHFSENLTSGQDCAEKLLEGQNNSTSIYS